MIASSILLCVGMVKLFPGDLFAYGDRFQHGAIAETSTADVVHLTASRCLEELVESANQVGAVDIVANLFALVAEDGVGSAGHGTLHQVSQETVQLGS